MKSKIKILVILLGLITISVVFSGKASAQQANVSFQVFYDQLSPYGQWVDYPNYGYVWIPDAGSDFVPYSTRGHWVLTDYGFTWVSDYNWGWAPFHYGRWNNDSYYGWFWVPDNEWGPAWVSWRRADGYYGWQPMEPGVSINISFGRPYNSQNDHWIFVRDRDIDRSDINRFYVDRIDHDRIVRNSTIINNTYFDSRRNTNYVSGPARVDVQKATGRRVSPVAIVENITPGQSLRNGRLTIYRPEVINNNSNGQRPAPARVTGMKDVKRPAAGNVTSQPPVNTTPAVNTRRNVQQKPASPSNNTTTKAIQQQNVTPASNPQRNVQQTTTNPQNSNNTKAVQQQNVKPEQKTAKVKQPARVRKAAKKQTVPPDKSKSIQETKKKD